MAGPPLLGGPELGEPKEGEAHPLPREMNDAEAAPSSGDAAKEGQEERAGPKKFSNRARLFFGNLPRDFTEAELKKMLTSHGEVQEIYHNREKNFAFARMVRGDTLSQLLLTSSSHSPLLPSSGLPFRSGEGQCPSQWPDHSGKGYQGEVRGKQLLGEGVQSQPDCLQ